MAVNSRVLIGADAENPTYTFEKHAILSLSTLTSVNLVGGELPIDTFTANVTYRGDPEFRKTKFGTPVWFYSGDFLIGKYYTKQIERVSAFEYKISCVSAVGLLEKQKHFGGIYTGETFAEVLADILPVDEVSFSYRVSDAVGALQVYGWLPYDTRRANLYQLIFAYNVSILKDDDGTVVFDWVKSKEEGTIELLEPDKIYEGGNCTYATIPSKVEVTEHSYRPVYDTRAIRPRIIFLPKSSTGLKTIDDEILSTKNVYYYNGDNGNYVTIFDNTGDIEPATNKLVQFEQAPIIVSTICLDPTMELDALKWDSDKTNPNCTYVTGQGRLLGIPYTSGERVYTLKNETAEEENVTTCSDATLVSLQNSDFVARRMLRYYSDAEEISNSFVVGNERCGNKYRFVSPFRESVIGYLTEMNIVTSSKLKANAKLVAAYSPVVDALFYSHYTLLSSEGSEEYDGIFFTPSEVMNRPVEERRIRVILISGGNGGQAGHDGSNGSDGSSGSTVSEYGGYLYTQPQGGSGGEPGTPGNGGKIRIVELKGNQVRSSYSYHLGKGGEGSDLTGDGVEEFSRLKKYFPESTKNPGDRVHYLHGDYEYWQCIRAVTPNPDYGTDWNPNDWEGLNHRIENGDDTIFGEYSTFNYTSSENGVANLFDLSMVIGKSGETGSRGGNGGKRQDASGKKYDESEDIRYWDEQTSQYISMSGKSWNGRLNQQNVSLLWIGIAESGYPGGPAAGGEPGDSPGLPIATIHNYEYYFIPTAGSKGGTAIDQGVALKYGQGGAGGHGGGGGGQGGSSVVHQFPNCPGVHQELQNPETEDPGHVNYHYGGKGGHGGKGGTGHCGCILVYY